MAAHDERHDQLHTMYLNYLKVEHGVTAASLDEVELDPLNREQFARFDTLAAADTYSLEWLQQYQPGKAHSRPRFANFLWRDILADVVKSAPSELGLDLEAIVIGEVPDPHYNAMSSVDWNKHQHLILINQGLKIFIYRFCRVLCAITPFRGGGVDLDAEIDTTLAKALMRHDLYLLFRREHGTPIPLVAELRVLFSTLQTTAMEGFVVAHEVGHILLDRFGPPSAYLPISPEQQARLKLPGELAGWSDELMADAWALVLCHGLTGVLAARRGMVPASLAPIVVVAPYLVIRLIQAIEAAARAHKIMDWTAYPPAQLRKGWLLQLQLAAGLSPTFHQLVEEAWTQVSELVEI